MANPGVGGKFVSVNLNKSYGQRPSVSGNATTGGGRFRSSDHAGGGGGGGMVVLSRFRNSVGGFSSQKTGFKLSVPPPLNLPSLRKEHERLDSSSGVGSAGAGVVGSGGRPSSAGIGWTKPTPPPVPVPSPSQEADVGNGNQLSEAGSQRVDGDDASVHSLSNGVVSRVNTVYMPPSARLGSSRAAVAAASVSIPPRDFPAVEKAVVLRGEDFPSLQATLPAASGPTQKHQKDVGHQKHSRKVNDDASEEQRDDSYLRPSLNFNPQNSVLRTSAGSSRDEKGGINRGLGGSAATGQFRKQDEFFPSPLPLVRLNHTSDWADDERDVGRAVPDRERDHGYFRSESPWGREYDGPRGSSTLPRNSIHGLSDGRSLRDEEAGRPSSRDIARSNLYSRDGRVPSREGRDGSSWKASPLVKDGQSAWDAGSDRTGVNARPLSRSEDTSRESKHNQLSNGDTGWDNFKNGFHGSQESRFGRRDTIYGQGNRQNGNYTVESFNCRGAEQNKLDRHVSEHSNRYRGDFFQNSLALKSSFSFGGKGTPVVDPILNFGRERRSSGGKQYLEDPFLKDFGSGTSFDGRDPLSGSLAGVIKKKKDVLKQADFHDPVRESFEAELDRVQKIQEQERQRAIEEQARVMELARKEEEERDRLAREEEERRRRLEEEAREAAWRAEQERMEAMRLAEEQKMAREEEKRRIILEEERRKEAARQKLLELEARIARRQAEDVKGDKFSGAVRDEKMLGAVKEKEIPRSAEVVDWEDGERMVERITSSASSDSSGLNRSFEIGSRPQFYRNGDYSFPDRKMANSWKRDVFENGSSSSYHLQDQENGYRSPRRDAIGAGRALNNRKEFYGGLGVNSSRSYPESHMLDDFPHPRGHRWNPAGDADHFSRNSEFDSDFHDNLAERFNDMGWGSGRSRSSPYAPYPDRLYQNTEMDGFSSFGRSRCFMRQPRVLPPPSLASIQKGNFKSDLEHPHYSYLDGGMSYHQAPRKSELNLQTAYDGSFQEHEQSGMMDVELENNAPGGQKGDSNTAPRCDSQSSLSVSSAPSSPTHLSHDDIEDSSYSPVLAHAAEGQEIPLSDNKNVVSVAVASNTNKVTASSSVSQIEDEEWTLEDNQELPEQEEYDEEENGYREEDEHHEVDDEHIDLPQELEDFHLEEKDPSSKMEQLVLGFNEGVEVGITTADDFDKLSGNGEKMNGPQQAPVNVLDEAGSFDSLVDVGQNLKSERVSSENGTDASRKVQENETVHGDLVIPNMNATHSAAASTGYLLDNVVSSCSSCPSLSQLPGKPVNIDLPSSTGPPILPSVSGGSNQADTPVKLQFGLFSGPSLIPSPVPAIQIGSIQMPLHLHPQVGPSLAQIHPPQPPFFQFGQVRYASPISQGILPLAPQSISFVQQSVPVHYSLNQNHEVYAQNQAGQEMQGHIVKEDASSIQGDNQPSLARRKDQSEDVHEGNVLPATKGEGNEMLRSECQDQQPLIGDSMISSGLISEVGGKGFHLDEKKNTRSTANNDEPQSHLKSEHSTSQFISKAPGSFSSSKGKRFIYTVKKPGSRQLPSVSELSNTETGGYQGRTRQKFRPNEFRIRENVDKKQTESLLSTKYTGTDEKPNFNARVSGKPLQRVKKDSLPERTPKNIVESDNLKSDPGSSGNINTARKIEKQFDKEVPMKKLTSAANISHVREVNAKRNISSEEDVDAPLQSGIVRVFKQSGIEIPSDEDDFIEVRSKRQMSNDRREQREKEIKAKSRIIKAPRKRYSISQNVMDSTNSTKLLTTSGGEAVNNFHSKSVGNESRASLIAELSTGFSTGVVTQPLAPIGTPFVMTDSTDKRSQAPRSLKTGFVPVMKNCGTNHLPVLLENDNVDLDNVSTSLSPWGNIRTNQQVMALTQTQFDEAMKPVQFDALPVSIGDHASVVIEPNKSSASIMSQEKSLSSSSSPLNSLLAGETIQFGAVTSPPILPPSSHAVSKGLGPPGSSRSDVSVDHKLSAIDSECPLFFEKEKLTNEACTHLEDPEAEAEAEAAASAVAVAAISSDEIVGNGLGPSVSGSDAKNFSTGENEGLDSGGIGSHQSTSQLRAEVPLSVALPADLSVETPSLSLWPPLPSQQNSSGQIVSHFPAAPPSHFPCYDMNPMLGGPIFAFGQHDESAGTQSQSQEGRSSSSGQLGAWQQCHSGMDSFYGPSAGFTGPFISPSGGIPGVQGPPHMVVYNHFAPVAQFGQVGLSFMGATYIPSGKQPDWKHNPASSATGINEGDINNLNIASAQRNPHSMPPPVQHLAPGSPLLPLASPLTMFDMSPFQSSTDIPVQARWSHVPASPLHSVPLSLPLSQQGDSGLSLQFSHGPPVDQPSGTMFREPRSSATQDGVRNLSVTTDATATQFRDELGLVDSSSTNTSRVLSNKSTLYSSTVGSSRSQSTATKSMSKSIGPNTGESGLNGDSNSSSSSSQVMSSALQSQSQQQSSSTQQQHIHFSGHSDHRGVGSHHVKVGSGGEWSHRRMGGFHGRTNQSSGTEKKVAPSKMKQVYVAKATRSQP